ncbi:hypothetical protein [Vibrio algarum]|uniref:Uncharacterized protein n=1 Tax=Vibrio algarum TaxID=3020714 RepID=A0ABT4YXD0_9VIBR|nr:hypothetical protein [Vibrio sp. KJ40-1]MDB1126211.1 hypothetical protein [Vibrio sp. KJ40-1]
MQIIDESHTLALVRGFKRKYTNCLLRKPKPLKNKRSDFKLTSKKSYKRIFEYIEYIEYYQRVLGNKITNPGVRGGLLCAHNVIVENNRIKIALVSLKGFSLACSQTGIVITDHAVARYLQREGITDVENAVRTLGLQLLLICQEMDDHSRKVGLPLKENQEIEAVTINRGYLFIEVGKVDPQQPLAMAELYLKTYISNRYIDGRNGVRPAIFEERYAD